MVYRKTEEWEKELICEILAQKSIVKAIREKISNCQDIAERLSLYDFIYSNDDFPYDTYQLSEWFNHEFGEFGDE